MAIYVPGGEGMDPTRQPDWYDGTYEYLGRLGIPELCGAPVEANTSKAKCGPAGANGRG